MFVDRILHKYFLSFHSGCILCPDKNTEKSMKTWNKKKQLDMLHGPIWNKIPQFALPVAATAILEQLFNASDIAVVGNFTGAGRTIAVAAVGAKAR